MSSKPPDPPLHSFTVLYSSFLCYCLSLLTLPSPAPLQHSFWNGTHISRSNVGMFYFAQNPNLSKKNNTSCQMSRNIMHQDSEDIEILVDQCPFPDVTTHPKCDCFLAITSCSHSFPESICFCNEFIIIFYFKAEALGLWVESISYLGCTNQRLFWSPFTENCFCSQTRLRREMAGLFPAYYSYSEHFQWLVHWTCSHTRLINRLIKIQGETSLRAHEQNMVCVLQRLRSLGDNKPNQQGQKPLSVVTHLVCALSRMIIIAVVNQYFLEQVCPCQIFSSNVEPKTILL